MTIYQLVEWQDFGLHNHSSTPCRGKWFLLATASRPNLGPTQQSSAYPKNEWSYISTPHTYSRCDT
jgi:hypothetical protein